MNLVRKRNLPFRWVLVCLAGCGGSTSSEGPGQTAHAVTFSRDVAPIFAQSCVYCHHTGSPTAVDFTHPFDATMGIIRRPNTWMAARAKLLVDPGNVDNSFLIDKVERTDLDPHVEGNRMPWGPPLVTADEVAAVRKWIADGAMDDAFFRDNVATLFGDGKSLGTKGGKCSYCHYENTWQLPDLTHPFDMNVGIVNVAGSRGGKLVLPGDPDSSVLVQKIQSPDPDAGIGAPMPKQFALLPQPQIDTLKAWIAAGAHEN